jgi:hypothetical protein
MKKLSLLLTVGFLAFSSAAFAQDDADVDHTVTVSVPEVAIVDMHTTGASNNISLGFTAPTEAGDPIQVPTANTDLWLNYSSIVASASVKRTITAQLSADLTGIDIIVTAGAPANSVGDAGSTANAVTLNSTTAQDVLTDIGSCYTTDGANNGSNLSYTLGLNTPATNYSNIFIDAGTAITVTYTITDDV